MWPIVILSILALAIVLERSWTLIIRRDRIIPRSFLRELEARLDRGEIEEAVVACRKDDSLMARVVLAGLSVYNAPRPVIREALEDAGRRESMELDRYLGVLAAIAGVSPLLGLLGTVLGMIQIFQEIESKHIGQYEHLAGGIYVALITTAAGLVVAIPSYLAYKGFSGIAAMQTAEMENWSVKVLNRLDRSPGKSRERKGGRKGNGIQETGTG